MIHLDPYTEECLLLLPFHGTGSLAQDAELQRLKAQGWRVESAFLVRQGGETVSLRMVRRLPLREGTAPPASEVPRA